MTKIIYLILGLILGSAIVWFFWGRKQGQKNSVGLNFNNPLIEKKIREKEENKKKILNVISSQGKFTNAYIQQSLGVSDASATRYLEELEREGLVKQVGKRGRYVYYEKT